MAATCQYCLSTIDIFSDTLLRDTCPFCGQRMNPLEEYEKGYLEQDFARVKFASILVGVIISKAMLRFDWLYTILLIPLGFLALFAAQELIDWVKHRKDPPGISLN